MTSASVPPCAQIPDRTSRCLIAFQYSEEPGTQICEVQYLDVPADAPKGDRYAWWLYHGEGGSETMATSETTTTEITAATTATSTAIRTQLLFQSMDGRKRTFQDGSRLDMELLVYVDSDGVEHALRAI